MRVEDAIIAAFVATALLFLDSWLLDRRLRDRYPDVRENLGSFFGQTLDRHYFRRMTGWWRFVLVDQFKLSDRYLTALSLLQAILTVLVFAMMVLVSRLAPAPAV